MKIVQSYWSRPSEKKEELHFFDRNKGGWVDKKYNYMSWALSCLQFRKFYENVELVTDSAGYDLLINKLELPYTNIKVCLDDLNEYHHDLWALGKIYAYSLQNEPFIHADGDIFIFKKFDESFEKSPLIAQNIERDFNYYNEVYDAIELGFNKIPASLRKSKDFNQVIVSVNAGLLGGNDIDFFKNYTKAAFKFVDDNLDKLDKVNIGMFNTVYEQFLFHALAEDQNKQINYYLKDINHAFDGLADFTAVPDKNSYIHTVGVYKRIKYIGDLLSFRLLEDYPDYYFKILNLIRTNQI